MKKYTIELTEKQLKGLAYACQETDRLILGQLDIPLQDVCMAAWEKLYAGNPQSWIMEHRQKTLDIVRERIKQLQELCWGLKNGEYNGVGYDDFADMLFDMQKVIEHALWLDKPEKNRNHCTNNAFPPNQISNEPLMTIKSK